MRAFSFVYWTLIVLTAPLFYGVLAIIWLVTLPFDRRRFWVHMFSCVWGTVFVYINPLWKLRTTGRDRLPWRGGAVLVANHSSLIDILVVYDLWRPFKWVSKASNFKIPFIGWGMTLNGYVSLVRGDRESVTRVMAECSELIDRGSPVMFFPEGTRSRDSSLQPFKDGAFELAVKHQVPLIPIAIHGTGRALPKHGMVLREHVDAHVEVLEPIEPGDDVAALRDEAHRRMAATLSS